MCGIAGYVAIEAGESFDSIRDNITRMTNSLRHRGPDDGGVWIDPAVSVALGHRRLSIIDLSADGHQPMISANGRYVLVFNGEIYNYRELRAALPYPYKGASDTEVMLAAFEKYGVMDALKLFNGMFAFGLWDRQERTLFLSCDRLGEKPLYYGAAGKGLAFGSELKALTAHSEFDPTINRKVIPLFLRYNYVPKPFSIYRDAHKVEPGTCLAFRWPEVLAPPRREVYWSARDAATSAIRNPFQGTSTEAAAEIERLLSDAVRMRMVADVPVGAFLSGGIDSTTIVALMQKHGSRPARTFTIGFSEKSYDETDSARSVAKHLGTEHTELQVTPEVAQSVIPRLSAIYDEPFADSSQIPTFLVSELARKHVVVALSGDGGDEIFGGYNRYVWAGQVWDQIRRYPPRLRSLAARAFTSISPGIWDVWGAMAPRSFKVTGPGDKVHKLAGILDASSQENLYHRLLSQWGDPLSVVPGEAELPTEISDRANWMSVDTFLRRMMLIDSIGYLPNDILVKVDRAAMAVGLETRTPYLDHRLFEFCWSLPDEWKIRDGESKWLLRQLLYRHVPRQLMERPKAGFGIPIDIWLRGPLRDWAEDLLDERHLREEGLLNPAPIHRKWAQHLSGKHNWCSPLWGILMLEGWLRMRRDVPAPVDSLPLVVAS